ncbi:hypothetical protein L3Q82_002355 [Scortum barcoo]|uniref:Uncharacterized protein n=1 Tax=Scortum barcoo TaxID=214431 RepID=A0ACB8VYG9_9TELE|nr:hypothetical protein L3Q82_002355 [Scortum barcoo]
MSVSPVLSDRLAAIMSDEDDESVPSFLEDVRVKFVEGKVCGLLRLRQLTWERSAVSEHFQTLLKDFFEKESVMFFSLSKKGCLVASNEVPPVAQNKHIYILKKTVVPISAENCREHLLFGLLSPSALLQLSSTVEQVCVPLLSNNKNHHMWPNLMSEDIVRHVESVCSKMSVVQGQVLGKTILPIPTATDWIENSYSTFKMYNNYDRALAHAIETQVINWTSLIQKILKEDSSDLLMTGCNPGPNAELKFWASRKSNMQNIYHQLQSPIVQKMAKMLEIMDSSYHPTVKTLIGNVFDDLLLGEDPEESLQMVKRVTKVFRCFRNSYQTQRERLADHVKHAPWDFPSAMIFTCFNQFLNRMLQLEDLLETMLDFQRMEKLEFGGLKGKLYSEHAAQMYREFSNHCQALKHSENSPLDLNSEDFEKQYKDFKERIVDFECRLASLLCLAFKDCSGLESAFKLLTVVGPFLERKQIRQLFSPNFLLLQQHFREELEKCKCFFKAQLNEMENGLIRNMAHTSGALKWAKMLRERIQTPWEKIRLLFDMYAGGVDMAKEYYMYMEMMSLLDQYEEDIYSDWCNGLEQACLINLNQPLLSRNTSSGLISVNFNPKLTEVLKDVKYIQTLSQIKIPAAAMNVFEKRFMFVKYVSSLQLLVQWYNKLKQTLLEVELPLIRAELESIDLHLTRAESDLTWQDPDCWTFISTTKDLVHYLVCRVSRAKENSEAIQSVMKGWSRQAMFCRKDNKKGSLIQLEDRADRVNKKYSSMKKDGDSIHKLVQENMVLFHADPASEVWHSYLEYVDEMVVEGLFSYISRSLQFFVDNMESWQNHTPLFEAQLLLSSSGMMFLPSLEQDAGDGLYELIEGLVGDIFKTSMNINRVAAHLSTETYQIDCYEDLHAEISKLEDFRVFNGWFRVDIKFFKGSLLNTIKKWSWLFMEHLLTYVTNSLDDLQKFVRTTVEGLGQPVAKGNRHGLVEVMGHLLAVRDRQAATDKMFEPLRDTVILLEQYGVAIPDQVYSLLESEKAIQDMEREVAELQESTNLFDVIIPDYRDIKLCRREIIVLKELWDIVVFVQSSVENWTMTKWRQINVDQMDAELRRFAKMDFIVSDNTTLEDLLALQLHLLEDEVHNIVDKAVKEMAIEKVVTEISQTWASMELSYEDHYQTSVPLLKCDEELIETLEDHQVQLQGIFQSKHVDHFMFQVVELQKQLTVADSVLMVWMEVQRTWAYLESIFKGCDDICQQLPADAHRFQAIDAEFQGLMLDSAKTKNVIEATNKPCLFEKLEDLQKRLGLCEKALAEYLETKRLAFPRFYFISSADLLDILSKGGRPREVTVHLSKLFDNMSDLEFANSEQLDNPKLAVGMYSKDREYVPFQTECRCYGPVEAWLTCLEESMKESVRGHLSEAVSVYEDRPREQWILDFPAQVALTGSQIWWSNDMELVFKRLEEGFESALKDYNKKQISQINLLIGMLLGDLSSGERQKIMTICTIDVHARDIVASLIGQKVTTSQAFQWLSQLRHCWYGHQHHCFVNICDAQFLYSYEYLGNTPRLVITPLTDRCYITLTQSLHLTMSGAPAGPAGTGKTDTTKDLGRAMGIMVYIFNCSEQMDYKSIGNIYKGLAQTGAWACFDEFNRIAVDVLSVVAVQVKTIQDAIRCKKKRFLFLDKEITLKPSVGIFITMNPGYAGRTELPENLKALFRPCAMVVPDTELICEIMLVAEGFRGAKVLARKFITLYTLCKELLSKQDHYDWGLRAVKSVLVVAGALRRRDKSRPEDQVLMRALRDFNMPKIVTEDVTIFLGLLGDLFPGLEILRVLYKTYVNLKRKPVWNDLNPKAVDRDELFGFIHPATREWKDGLLSSLMREQANISHIGPKWIVLDGDIDPMWIESLNTVMDDNKVLTLASNERVPLTSSMRLVFEISHLRTATPATVSRAGILYVNHQDLGWNPYVASWIDQRDRQTERAHLTILFEKYVPRCLEQMRNTFKTITPIPENSMVQTLCTLLDCLLTPENIPFESPRELYETYFTFACIWAFGGALYQDQLYDYRVEFSQWWTKEMKTVKLPAQGTVFDYYLDPQTRRFLPWSDTVPPFEMETCTPLQAVLVHTAETVRLRYFMDLLLERRQPVMLVGNAGVGKTALVRNKLDCLPESYMTTKVPFNYYTSSLMLQAILEQPLEKRAGRSFSPVGNRRMVYFIDDLNMPAVDSYGTVQPHTLIRQHLDYGHWYDRQKLTLKEIHNTQYVACMNPTAGSFSINPRLQRHFSVFAVNFPSSEAQMSIFSQILCGHLKQQLFSPVVQRSSAAVIQAAISLHHKMVHSFLPTAIKFHYTFNLRDLSNVFQGILFAGPESVKESTDLALLWLHESCRVYSDRLVDVNDLQLFRKLQMETVHECFEGLEDKKVTKQPLLYCHFAQMGDEASYTAVSDWSVLTSILTDALESYNELNAAMNLVLFEDAVHHVCRISRILESPRGHGLLVGVGGSGKQSLTRLAAYISSVDVFQITLSKGYSIQDLKMDLAGLFIKAGVKNQRVTLLLTDAQIPDERFLVIINDLIASGEIPELFSEEEVEGIVSGVRAEVRALGLLDNRENCWRFFTDRVRLQLKVILCLSPVGSALRVRARRFPALVQCTTIDWFHPWTSEALQSVSYRFIQEIEGIEPAVQESISLFMAHVHTSVNQASEKYQRNEKRYNYTTPKSFLQQITLYRNLLEKSRAQLQHKMNRLDSGLQKLQTTATQVEDLKAKLASQEAELTFKKQNIEALITKIGLQTERVSSKKEVADAEAQKVAVIQAEVSVKQKDCENDLAKAEPSLTAATAALHTLNKVNLTELKAFPNPPAAVINVAAAVMVLLAPRGRVPKDRSWKAARAFMGKVDDFLQALVSYDKEHIPESCLTVVKQQYLKNPEFYPDLVRTKSTAAAGLCAWTINIVRYYEDLDVSLQSLTAQFERATTEKISCQEEVTRTNQTIELANRLVKGLEMLYKDSYKFVVCLLCNFKMISKVSVPLTDGLDPILMLTDDATVAAWHNQGLPNDRMSTENAAILTTSERWPLIIDPQQQGIKWIRNRLGSELRVVQLGQKGYIRLGGKECEYNSNFRLIIHTKMANPQFPPELQAQTTLINFTVTPVGLEEQLLGQVVSRERPDLEVLKMELTAQQNHFKIELKRLEDDLLNRLSAAHGNFLGDISLVEQLENTKTTAAHIQHKVVEARENETKINEARELYRPAAERASLLFFIINDLSKINLMYQFSLKIFNSVFNKAMERAEWDDDVRTRVHTLTEAITYSVFLYTSQGLFERDKLTFLSHTAFQILLKQGLIDAQEFDFLLRFPVEASKVSPVSFLSPHAWGAIKTISTMEDFSGLDREVESSPKRWRKIVESSCPEKERLPQDWKNKSSLQKLIILRALRPDRMTYTLRNFVEESMGTKYVEASRLEFDKLYEDSGPSTPVFFILSPGVDPLKDVEKLGLKLGFSIDQGTLHNVSLGQGQEEVAERVLNNASKLGHWVILQNVHLVARWLPSLDALLETAAVDSHPNYRVFITGEPAQSPEQHVIPRGILENAIKITNEPPTGMNASLHAALNNFSQDTLDLCSREQEFNSMFFSLCFFHACVTERRKFGPQGWNHNYPFSTRDLTISASVLYNYLEANTKFEGELSLCPGFLAPPFTDYSGYHSYIDEHLPPENPSLYGLHPNAELECLTVKSVIEDILDKLPEEYNMAEIMAKTSKRSPYILVCFQECERMNLLLAEIKKSLNELDLGLKGELTITSNMETLQSALFSDSVPDSWARLAYPSTKTLAHWFWDIMCSCRELDSWTQDLVLPAVVWLSGLFNPQSFLTAVLQSIARKNQWPLDKMTLTVDVTKKTKDDFGHPPREGAYIHGLFMEGARWDTQSGVISEAVLRDLTPPMPVLYVRALPTEEQDLKNTFQCPVYRTKQRGPTLKDNGNKEVEMDTFSQC